MSNKSQEQTESDKNGRKVSSEQTDGDGQSLFKKTLKMKQDALQNHKKMDQYIRMTKRQTLLHILHRIKENPPPYLLDPKSEYKMKDLENVINDLSKITVK